MEFFTGLKSRLPFRAPRTNLSGAAHWNRLLECDQFLVAEIDRGGLIRAANREFCRVRESSPEDIIGTSLLYLVNVEDRSAVSEMVNRVFGGKGAGSVRARLLTDGEIDPVVAWAFLPLPDGEGEIGVANCIGVDLTRPLEEANRSERSVAEMIELKTSLERMKTENAALRKELEKRAAASKIANETGPIPGLEREGGGRAPTLGQLERRYIIHTLERTGGRVSGPKGAAAVLGLHPNTLRSRMEKLGIERVA